MILSNKIIKAAAQSKTAKTGPKVIKLFPFYPAYKFVGILTFISTINKTSARLKARNFFICRYFSFYEQLKFRAQLS